MAGFWNYLKQLFRSKSEQLKDPEIEIEQVITEARERDQDLRNQAAKVIAHRTMVEHQLEDSASDVGKAKEMAKQALLRADEATRSGDAEAAGKWNRAAQSLAMKLQAAQNNIDSLKQQYQVAVQQSEQAKQAVQQNAQMLQQKLAEKQKLMGQLDQAKMQEQMNKAMATLSETVGEDVPTLNEVRDKIERRYAKALGTSELQGQSVESRMLEVEQASMNSDAQARLAEIRTKLGIASASEPAGEVQEGGTTSS